MFIVVGTNVNKSLSSCVTASSCICLLYNNNIKWFRWEREKQDIVCVSQQIQRLPLSYLYKLYLPDIVQPSLCCFALFLTSPQAGAFNYMHKACYIYSLYEDPLYI